MKLPGWLGHPYTHASAMLLSLLAALAVLAFMAGTLEYTKTRGRLLLTALMVSGYFLSTLTATGAPNDRVSRWLYATIPGFATLALLLLLVGLWTTPDSNEYWKTAASITFLTLGMSLIRLGLRLGSAGKVARALTRASTMLTALLTAMTLLGIALEVKIALYWWGFALMSLCWLAVSVALAAVRLWRKGN